MRKAFAALMLILWLAVPASAQSPVNGQTNIPNWLWVKPTIVDRTARAFCVWGGMSLSLVNSCDFPLVGTDGSMTPSSLKLPYQTGVAEPAYGGAGLWCVTPQTSTWDFIGASTSATEHTLLIEAGTDTGGTPDPYVIVRAIDVNLSGLAQTSYRGDNSTITHSAGTHSFNNLATFVNLRVSTDTDLRGDVYDGAGTFTIADNVQINGTLDVWSSATSQPTYGAEWEFGGYGTVNFPTMGLYGLAGGILQLGGDPDTSSYNGTIKFLSANRSTSDANTARFVQINGRSNGTGATAGGRLEFDFVPDAGSIGTYAHWSSAGLRLGDGTASSYLLELNADSAGKPTTSTWTIVSDRKAKKNIQPLNRLDAYDRIKRLNLKTYAYTGEFGTIEDALGVGLLADEVALEFPNTVSTLTLRTEDGLPLLDKDDLPVTVQTFNPHDVFMANLAVVQELMARVEALEARVVALEGKKP